MSIHKQFTVLRAQQKEDSILNGLEMDLNEIVVILYVVDILFYTVIAGNWEIGVNICKYCEKLI